jgi:hypothetical protein
MQVNSNICGSADLPLIAHSPSSIAYSLLPYSPWPILPVALLLCDKHHRIFTFFNDIKVIVYIMAQLLQKLLTKETKNEEVTRGILIHGKVLNFILVH